MKKPATLVYGVDDNPPWALTLLNAVQHVALIAINLIYPVLVFSVAGTPVKVVGSLLAAGMLVLAIGTLLQSLHRAPLGSGYLCPSTFTATYLGPSLLAAKIGGLPLVFGMTLFAGIIEAALAPLLNRLRAVFPPEISGLVIFMIGWSASISGLRLMLGGSVEPVRASEWVVAGATIATMVALNVWGRGSLRMLCALIGLVFGYIASGFAGLFTDNKLARIAETAWLELPSFGHYAWSIDPALIAPFAIGAVAAAMKAIGTISMCQRTNDAEWVRPDMRNATKGVFADGVSTAIAGAMGAVGTNTSTPSVGLASSTGMAARRVAYAVAGTFAILAMLPKVSVVLAVMPRPVMVAGLLFAMSAIIINGIQVISSRLLDARRTFVIALSIVAGTAVDIFPGISQLVPPGLSAVTGSSLVLATVLALSLNLLFRIGVKKTVVLNIDLSTFSPQTIEDFFKKQGGAWGARPDIITRATFGVIQLLDVVRDNSSNAPVSLAASFDEFNLDVRVTYEGSAIEIPDQRPTPRQIRDSDDGARLMAGFMLRKCADRLRSSSKDGSTTLHMHYDH